MSGIVGFTNLSDSILSPEEIIMNMNESISHKGTNEKACWINEKVLFAHNSTIEKNQIMHYSYQENTYSVIFNGNIYNLDELKEVIKRNGFNIETEFETEIILKLYCIYKEEIVKKLNGVFGFCIWDEKNETLFLARDHFGIKPLYYSICNNELIFSSDINGILNHPFVETAIDSNGICEMLGIGPAHSPGTTVFKDIFEIKPAHYAIFNKNGFKEIEYWKLESKPHTDSMGKTCERIKYLLEDSINNQLKTDMKLCSFLSGGLDSSIITLYASNYFKDQNLGQLDTYSVDYLDNDKNFVKNDFQPNSDNLYIDLMNKKLYSNHHKIILDTPELVSSLENAMEARCMPGMADIDSSLLLFCDKVKPYADIALTGECADEIFAGYPWFFREDALNSNTFPWSIAINERQKMLNDSYSSSINLKHYIDNKYKESLDKVDCLETDSIETTEKRKISYLTLNWFMQTLLDRAEKMSNYCGFELRVPFCDYRIVEYMWNIPWEIKALNGREKGLLRYIMKDKLPSEIVDRKKSPYPKTYNPNYLAKVKEMLSEIMQDNDAPINYLLNRKYILEILETDGKAFSRPWFGQLMTGPQVMAYLIQINMWLVKYNPQLSI